MDSLGHLAQGFVVAAKPINLLVAFVGSFIGTVVGLLPGLGPINGVAILLPIAFAMKLPPETSLILLAAEGAAAAMRYCEVLQVAGEIDDVCEPVAFVMDAAELPF